MFEWKFSFNHRRFSNYKNDELEKCFNHVYINVTYDYT